MENEKYEALLRAIVRACDTAEEAEQVGQRLATLAKNASAILSAAVHRAEEHG